MRARLAGICLAFTALAVACSVVDDGKVERIEPQFGLDDTLPSSTSITTTTSFAETTTTGSETTTTTTTPVQTEPVQLYFVASGQLTYVLQSLASPVTLPQMIARLQEGPPEGDLGAGLSTLVPQDAEILVSTANGIAYVTLPLDFFELVPVPIDQRYVIAQLVLTLTSSRGIGQVVFNLRVPLPLGQERPAGQQLTFSDYSSLTGSNPHVPESTAPSATTSTTGG